MKINILVVIVVSIVFSSILYCTTLDHFLHKPDRILSLSLESVSIDKDNESFLFRSKIYDKSRIIKYNKNKDNYKKIANHNYSYGKIYSKNKERIYYFSILEDGSKSNISVIDRNGEKERILTNEPTRHCTELVVSPDEKYLYYNKPIKETSHCQGWTDLYSINIENGHENKLTSDSFFSVGELQISNDGKHLFFSTMSANKEIDTYSTIKFNIRDGMNTEFLPETSGLRNKEHLIVVPNSNYFYVCSDLYIKKVNQKGEYLETIYSFKEKERKCCYSISPNSKIIMFYYVEIYSLETRNKCDTLINNYYSENTCYGLFDFNKMQEEFVKVDAYKILELFEDEKPVVQ